MRTAWHLFVVVAATTNAIRDGVNWYHGEPATNFVWLFCVLFSVGVALESLESLTARERQREGQS